MNKLHMQYATHRFTAEQRAAVERAEAFAVAAHQDQQRASGEPFVIHPLAVAEIVAGWGMDHEAVMAALLHDVVEDTTVTLQQLEQEFGSKVAELVDGVTKLRLSASPRLDPESNRRQASSENLRKLLLASTKDIRVLLLKLADRLHNLRTLEFLPADKRRLIALESLEVFAPLADRLGMGVLKGEMEDLGFQHAMPEAYANLAQQVQLSARQGEKELAIIKRGLVKHVRAAGVTVVQIEGRRKHYYSIHKKLAKVDGDLSKIYDLVAVRMIVPDVSACYQALGIVHQLYKPLIHRIKDYIAVPKPNGYQSLHTTVFGPEGRITEIQIRTPQMHEEAEYGLAAHFYYDQQKHSKQYQQGKGTGAVPNNLHWVEQLSDLQRSTGSTQEFVEGARLELFRDQIYVFSPKGDLYELPEGATPLDFAFAVHSNVGLRAMGARVNGRMAGLDTRLENRDVVEIVTRREPAPNRDWLNFVVTTHAKNRIRAWFRAASRDANVAEGRVMLEAGLVAWGMKRLEDLPKRAVAEALDNLHLRSLDDLLVQLAEGALSLNQAIKRLFPDAGRPANVPVVKRTNTTGRVLVMGKHLSYTLAPCCQPVYPQPIVGFVTRGKGVTVHVMGCRNLPGEPERLIACKWETTDEQGEWIVVRMEIGAVNRVGIVSDITGAIARQGLRLAGISSGQRGNGGEAVQIQLGIEVSDLFELADVMRRLRHIPGVTLVRRVLDLID
ncbi:MAG TPA: bifunctional (p)ppGpp synthetase/guanosine-3',5'-bis(diphosphate) 3'-pyrophosphohydrolase [Candidatus Saccharimonadia bacterium]